MMNIKINSNKKTFQVLINVFDLKRYKQFSYLLFDKTTTFYGGIKHERN